MTTVFVPVKLVLIIRLKSDNNVIMPSSILLSVSRNQLFKASSVIIRGQVQGLYAI